MAAPSLIGILGGMGPEATILLQQKLVRAVSARDDSDHIPLLIDMNPQVPSRIAHLFDGTGTDPGPVLAAMAQRLQSAGATALAMPCNTAHHYAPAIAEAVNIPLFNMVELTADHAAKLLGKGRRVGMLASPAARRSQLFDAAFAKRGLSVLWPADDASMLAAVREIKAVGPCPDAIEAVVRASRDLSARGADLQVIACSEFSLISDCLPRSVNVVDTLDLLARKIVREAQGLP